MGGSANFRRYNDVVPEIPNIQSEDRCVRSVSAEEAEYHIAAIADGALGRFHRLRISRGLVTLTYKNCPSGLHGIVSNQIMMKPFAYSHSFHLGADFESLGPKLVEPRSGIIREMDQRASRSWYMSTPPGPNS